MAKKYIEADELIEHIEIASNYRGYQIKHALQDVKDFPAADVVEVVRCKDCRYMLQTEGCALDRDRFMREEEDYCSYGEREDG